MILPASAISPSRATKPNGRLERSSAPVAPISRRGAVVNTQGQPREALQPNHQDRQHHDGHEWEHGDQRAICLDALLDRSSGLDAVTVRQGVLDALELGFNLLAD